MWFDSPKAGPSVWSVVAPFRRMRILWCSCWRPKLQKVGHSLVELCWTSMNLYGLYMAVLAGFGNHNLYNLYNFEPPYEIIWTHLKLNFMEPGWTWLPLWFEYGLVRRYLRNVWDVASVASKARGMRPACCSVRILVHWCCARHGNLGACRSTGSTRPPTGAGGVPLPSFTSRGWCLRHP